MKNIECYVVSDLLPLYIDKACSEQTAKFVERHLQSCENCRKLYEEMSADICLHTPEFEEKTFFKNIYKQLLGIILALTFMISCFVINTGGAWEGSPAKIQHLVITISYLFFWGIFSILSRKYKPLTNVSFVLSLLTVISSINGVVWRMLNQGGFISAYISIFTAIPFYGLRMFFGWTEVYTIASIISLCWLIYTGRQIRKLNKALKEEGES